MIVKFYMAITAKYAGLFVLLSMMCTPLPAQVQGRNFTFDATSDGSDGALTLTTPGDVIFDPESFTPPLDQDGDGVFHFTTIEIAAGVNVILKADTMGMRPVVWLVSGEVQIFGEINLNGGPGHNSDQFTTESIPGAGGFSGGRGRTATSGATAGNGPGAGFPPVSSSNTQAGGGGGFAENGESVDGAGGTSYGNQYLLPLIGGSGGGGGRFTSSNGGGGGAGGGAILVASSERILVDGAIRANGGRGGAVVDDTFYGGGGGSGGAIRLMAPEITGGGTLEANGGTGRDRGGDGSPGRIRLEAFRQLLSNGTNPTASLSTPGPIFLPEAARPVKVVSVGGVAVPANPSGGFTPSDLVINETGETAVEIAGQGIPPGTVVQLVIWSETGGRTTLDSTPLVGTLEASTATANVVIPSGFSRFFVQANWSP